MTPSFTPFFTPSYTIRDIVHRCCSCALYLPPARCRQLPKVDLLCFFSDCIHIHLPDSGHPNELNSLGRHVAATAGRRCRGCGDVGGSPRTASAVQTLCASRVHSVNLGRQTGHVGGTRHTPTRNAELCRASADPRPPSANWPPHSDERSDKIQHTGPLRGPLRVNVSVFSSQYC